MEENDEHQATHAVTSASMGLPLNPATGVELQIKLFS